MRYYKIVSSKGATEGQRVSKELRSHWFSLLEHRKAKFNFNESRTVGFLSVLGLLLGT